MKEKFQNKCNLQQEIIDELFHSLLKKQPKNNSYFSSYFNKKITDIFKLEIEYLGLKYISPKNKKNDVEIIFYNKPTEKIKGAFNPNFKNKHAVFINMGLDGYTKLKSSNSIDRLTGLKTVLKTLFHELRHLKQYLLIEENKSSKIVLRNAKEFMLASSKTDKFNKIYKENHDVFAIEVDADFKAINDREKLITSFPDLDDRHIINVIKSNRDINKVVINNRVMDRDTFIDSVCDLMICKEKESSLFDDYPVLLKEYNSDCTKKSLSALINNMNDELDSILDIKDEEYGNYVFNETLEFYFELIYKRLKNQDMFELYDAVKDYGKEEINSLCINIDNYFRKEKRRKLNLLKEKYNSESVLYKDLIIKNDGKIQIESNGSIDLIDTDSYVEKYIPIYDNTFINLFLHSKAFKSRIPSSGEYILKNGSKITVPNYINNIFIPETKRINSKLTIVSDFDNLINNTVKPQYEVEYLKNCEYINKDYQRKQKRIDELLSYKILDKDYNSDNDIIGDLDDMKLVCNINSKEVKDTLESKLLCYMDTINNEYYYVFTKNQIEYFLYLFQIASSLNNNETFNPHHLNYFSKFKNNEFITNIRREIERYYSLLENNSEINRAM